MNLTRATLIFPRLDRPTLDNLDAWLAARGEKSKLIVLSALPTGRRLRRALADLSARHRAGILIQPQSLAR